MTPELSATLYVVSTPIGNMKDISERALDILQSVDIIYAEDTRQTDKLLKHFHIKNKIKALHKHNESSEKETILSLLQSQKTIALVSDAGTPLIADPGFSVIFYLRQHEINIQAIPGCCSVIAALSISGLDSEGFSFEGFIPSKATQRQKFLENYQYTKHSTVFFETPHRIIATIQDFQKVLAPNRQLFIARELTKQFEETKLTNIANSYLWISENQNRSRGEFILILGASEIEAPNHWQQLATSMHKHGINTKTISKVIAEQYHNPKKEVYDFVLSLDDSF